MKSRCPLLRLLWPFPKAVKRSASLKASSAFEALAHAGSDTRRSGSRRRSCRALQSLPGSMPAMSRSLRFRSECRSAELALAQNTACNASMMSRPSSFRPVSKCASIDSVISTWGACSSPVGAVFASTVARAAAVSSWRLWRHARTSKFEAATSRFNVWDDTAALSNEQIVRRRAASRRGGQHSSRKTLATSRRLRRWGA
eukprot:scaffold4971_cov254-Pinguiococcus_pyrenoidosus.AAC.19